MGLDAVLKSPMLILKPDVLWVYRLNSSLLECPPAVQEVGGSYTGRDMSVSGALVEDGGNRIAWEMARTTSHQRSIFKIKKPLEIIIY